MDNGTVRIAVGLRLCIPICQPHICHHCGGHAIALATSDSVVRLSRKAEMNAVMQRSLAAVSNFSMLCMDVVSTNENMYK